MTKEFINKTAIVTGGSSGIGAHICKRFASHGTNTVCVDIDKARGERLVNEIVVAGGKAVFIHADVTSPQSVASYVEQTLASFATIDIFINNAGFEGDVKLTENYPVEVFDRVMAINVKGVFLGLKYVLPVMKKQGHGVIINTGSTGSHIGAVGVSAYTASKHAVLGLTKSSALEAAPYGVRVNAICPGGTATRMLDSLSENRMADEALDFNLATPNGRIANPEEIADIVLFLTSNSASHIVGQSLIVDGGRLAM